MALGIGGVIKRYCLVTVLPLFVVSTIYADYSRTQLYKAQAARSKDVSDLT